MENRRHLVPHYSIQKESDEIQVVTNLFIADQEQYKLIEDLYYYFKSWHRIFNNNLKSYAIIQIGMTICSSHGIKTQEIKGKLSITPFSCTTKWVTRKHSDSFYIHRWRHETSFLFRNPQRYQSISYTGNPRWSRLSSLLPIRPTKTNV